MEIKLLGSFFTKVLAERNVDFNGNLDIKQNIQIKKINGFNKPGNTKNNTLEIEYIFEVKYSTLGKIEILGKIYLGVDDKFYAEALGAWKEKRTNSNEQVAIINIIVQKATIKAFELEEELGLPLHIPLPSIKPSNINKTEKVEKADKKK